MNMTNGISSFNEHRPSSPDNDPTARSGAFRPRSMSSDAQSRAMEDWQQALLRSIAGDGEDDTGAPDAHGQAQGQGQGQGCHGQGSQHTQRPHHNRHDHQFATGPTMGSNALTDGSSTAPTDGSGNAPTEGSGTAAMQPGNGATPACQSDNARGRLPQDAIAPDRARSRMFL
jgi:hypothetical protein